jgi:hypothetical protein
VARYADACNIFASTVEDVMHKLDVLREHCEAEGWDYNAIKKTAVYMDPILGNTDTFLAAAEQYAALGIQELDLMPDRNPLEFTEQVVELVARVAAI